MNICKRCGQSKTDDEMDRGRDGRPSRSTCKKCRSKMQAKWKRNHPNVAMAQWARRRAKVNNLPFSIEPSDIIIPEYCPVLGIKLEPGDGKLHDASPTLDRIVSEKGYVKGNIAVISYKANRMKQDATLEELEALTSWVRKCTDNTEATCESRESVETTR